jgi:hypothetical protein
MRLLHTSELRVGAAFPQAWEQAEALRDARLEAVRSLLAVARREKVDGIVLAGNTLASNQVAMAQVFELAAVLATSPVPVYLVPGELDPLTEDSPYRRTETFRAPVQIVSVPPTVAVAPAAEAYDWGQEVGSVLVEGRRIEIGRFRWLDWERSPQGLEAELKGLVPEQTLLRLTLTGSVSAAEWRELHELLGRQRLYHLVVRDRLRVEGSLSYAHPLLRALEGDLLSQARVVPTGDEVGDDSEVARHALGTLARVLAAGGREDLV